MLGWFSVGVASGSRAFLLRGCLLVVLLHFFLIASIIVIFVACAVVIPRVFVVTLEVVILAGSPRSL